MEWLDKVYQLVKDSNDKNYFTEKALDLVFDHFDDLFTAGKFDEANEILTIIDLKQLNINLLSGIMSATYPAKDKLSNRPILLDNVRSRLMELAPDRAERIMRGL